MIFEHFQTVRCWLDVIEISRIVVTCYISYKLMVNQVNVSVSKMAFPRKIQLRLNQEGGVYGNSRRQSQSIRDYSSDLHHAPIKDLDFLAVWRTWLRILRAAEARINTSTISTC